MGHSACKTQKTPDNGVKAMQPCFSFSVLLRVSDKAGIIHLLCFNHIRLASLTCSHHNQNFHAVLKIAYKAQLPQRATPAPAISPASLASLANPLLLTPAARHTNNVSKVQRYRSNSYLLSLSRWQIPPIWRVLLKKLPSRLMSQDVVSISLSAGP